MESRKRGPWWPRPALCRRGGLGSMAVTGRFVVTETKMKEFRNGEDLCRCHRVRSCGYTLSQDIEMRGLFHAVIKVIGTNRAQEQGRDV